MAKARKLKHIDKHDLSSQAKDFYAAINEGTDLACVLISSSFLDECLKTLLMGFFIEDSETARNILNYSGVIGTFSSRKDLAYCLGLISKELHRNLKTTGEIRNKFAHNHLSLTFADVEVAELADQLTFPSVLDAVRIEGNDSQQITDPFDKFKDPRIRFSIITTLMVNEIIGAAMSTEHRPNK